MLYSARYILRYIPRVYIYTQNSDFHSEFTSYKSKFEFVSRNSYFFSKFSEVYISQFFSHHKIQNKFSNCDFFFHKSDFLSDSRNTHRKCLNC